jgi:hypothetical protein
MLAGVIMVNSDRIKVIAAFTLLAGLVGLCGCVHQYLMTMSDGERVLSLTKPKLQGTNCFFTDATGTPSRVSRSRVVKIRAVTPVKEAIKPAAPSLPVKASVKPAPPLDPAPPKKPKHWYFLWLA